MSADLETAIEAAWDDRANVTPQSADVREAVEAALAMLDSGTGRVAEPDGKGGWTVNQWLKKAVLLSFRLNDNRVMEGGSAGHPAFDKVPSKFAGWDDARFREAGFRVVPGAVAREGAYIAPGLRADAELRQYRRLCRQGHHGRHLGQHRQLRADRRELPYLGRCRYRRRARTDAGQPDHYRRQLLHRRAKRKSSRA